MVEYSRPTLVLGGNMLTVKDFSHPKLASLASFRQTMGFARFKPELSYVTFFFFFFKLHGNDILSYRFDHYRKLISQGSWLSKEQFGILIDFIRMTS